VAALKAALKAAENARKAAENTGVAQKTRAAQHAWPLWRRLRRAALPFALGIAPALAAPLGPMAPQSVLPAEVTDEFARLQLGRTRFVRLVAELDRLTAETFTDAAPALIRAGGIEAEAALVLVAGRGVPTGLSTARETERRAHRAAALALLNAERENTRALLDALLERPPRPNADGAESSGEVALAPAPVEGAVTALCVPCSYPALRAAAAQVVGALGFYDLAPRVAGLLDVAEPSTVVAARDALHLLHGRWYPGRAAFRALWPRLEGKGAAELFLDELAERERTAEARLLALFEAQPSEHLGAAFAEPNPQIRARVAALASRAVGARTLTGEEAWTRLRAQLEVEPVPVVAEALIGALLELLQGAPGNDSRVADLRGNLREVVTRGNPALSDLLLRALPRLPQHDGEGVAAADLALASELVMRMVDGSRPLDPDLVPQGFAAFAAVARRVQDPEARRAVTLGASQSLRRIVAGEFGALGRTRIAAADALASILTAADVDVLLELARGSEDPNVRYRLLGVLVEATPLVAAPRERARIVETLLRAAESPTPAVRARAVELLADPRVAEAVATARATDPNFERRLVELLRGPGADAERIAVLDVLSGTARPELLVELLRADVLRPLATGAPQVLDGFVRAVQRIARKDDAALWRAADLLTLELPGTEEVDRPSRPRRVGAALRLVLQLDESAAIALDVARQRRIVAWALELRGAGAEVGESFDEAARARLSGVHIAAVLAAELAPNAAGPAPADAQVAVRVLRALLAVDRLGERATLVEREATLVLLDEAHAALVAGSRPYEALRLRVERGRIADGAERRLEAEADFSAVFEGGPELLASRDLRRLAVLARENRQPDRAAEALLVLVDRVAWRTRPAEVRLADLQALVEVAPEVEDRAVGARIRATFVGIPPLAPNGRAAVEAADSATAVWSGLVAAGRAEHERLLGLVKILERLAPLAPPVPGAGTPAPANLPPGEPGR